MLKISKKQCISLIILAIIILLTLIIYQKTESTKKELQGFQTNQKFIEGLYQDIDLSNTEEVFEFVFNSLEDNVIIYPTENYYYFKFSAQGKTIGGTFSLPARNRDEGNLGFGYTVRNEDPSSKQPIIKKGGGKIFNSENDLKLTKINNQTYKATYKGKTVTFHLYNHTLDPPKKANLLKEEIYVGPVFDESGLKFYLLYNKEIPHFYYILNEDNFVPDSFSLTSGALSLGERTQFLFYNDFPNNRKILVGAAGRNVLQNNWYDGPFDQLPDNYIKTDQIQIKELIEASYPGVKDNIDKYGYYKDQNGTRVAISPYTIYFNQQDITLINNCKNKELTESEFYVCLTTQRYDVEDDYYQNHYI